jgi:murein L,D-transpeptidase YcbB/YkuD
MFRSICTCLVVAKILVSCSDGYHPVTIDFFENDSIPFKEKLQKVLEPEYLKEMGFNEDQTNWLITYYENHDFKPHWVNDSMITQAGLNMRHLLKRSLWFGIPENRIELIAKRKRKLWVEEEILLTARFSSLISDLNHGFMDLDNKRYKSHSFEAIEKMDSLFNMRDTLNLDKIVLSQGGRDSNYRFLANKLYSYCLLKGVDRTEFNVPTQKMDSVKSLFLGRKALHFKRYLNEKDSTIDAFNLALKTFQRDNGLKQDGRIGEYTARALNESSYRKVLRAGLSLEKIRCHDKFPEKFVRINIPEYLLRLVIKDTIRQIHRIIVGKPENKTPELRSKIHDIVLYPYWNVPYSIAGKEVLPAVKANINYLARNHYKIYRGDQEVNPLSVNWKHVKENTFPYKLVQQPGRHNSLGIVKFEFYSNYSIYLHDTPTKHLFNKDIRAFSHGCIRCQYPDSLAKTILTNDSLRGKANPITGFMIDSLLQIIENRKIKLLDPVPVYIEYQTVFADREQLIFYVDIYYRDEPYIMVMMNE